MKLTLGFSPCPNDTFIFDAMVHGRIDTEGLEFDYFLADVEELNRRAFSGSIDITKMSCFAYAYAAQDYLILDSGSALGHKNGPLADKQIQSLIRQNWPVPELQYPANILPQTSCSAWPGLRLSIKPNIFFQILQMLF